ncbi:RES family NAD+ phosphorylase [Methanococcoides orientis]|uniref:RES family NAD+ phosphorylase n=1 Tax=Methanococcoides orientis TaxID=2822137 RepID=UPI001E5711FB|nr:RES family NAD+ phosphorylase [Methanococcoides orientis]UGV39816.1 RES family NAD+ phosphorylase [Methanococcoides orientis]
MENSIEQKDKIKNDDDDFMDDYLKDVFFDVIFFEEMESWFSTNFFLCDNCINEFKKKYKGIHLADGTLELNMIPLDCFYHGTLLLKYYTSDEFKKYLKGICCPFCFHSLEYSIYPYDEFVLDTEKYQDDIEKISIIAASTPFLLMTNSLAKSTLNLIKKLADLSTATKMNTNVYRGRVTENPDILLNPDEMEAVPDSKAFEGRFNHLAHGHLYVATSKEICSKEIDPTQTKSKCIATIKLLNPLKILDLTDFHGSYIYNKGLDEDLYKAILTSALIYNSPSENSWEKPEYVFTRFVADCAIFAGFDGIKYKSRYDFEGANYVIFKDKSKEDFNWDFIYLIEKVESMN